MQKVRRFLKSCEGEDKGPNKYKVQNHLFKSIVLCMKVIFDHVI